ncbi:hypothetical protein AAOE16_16790 [Ekhidna sp. MALMAid0563]|uniref:hypothetical protein n=1 Tax=Ekhidna sp. MALMAid0563 TaxID=3143937 RepID=UPI0032DFE594
MDDFSFWWYIIAAVIYFLTRGKKKKEQPNSRPGSENRPPQNQPKSFEDLLREITEGRQEEEPTIEQDPVVIDEKKNERKEMEDATRLEGERRAFADDESKRVYEESIKMAEGADLEFDPDEHYRQPRLFKGDAAEEEEWTIADEIRDGLNSSEAKKAIIYSEILNRKY